MNCSPQQQDCFEQMGPLQPSALGPAGQQVGPMGPQQKTPIHSPRKCSTEEPCAEQDGFDLPLTCSYASTPSSGSPYRSLGGGASASGCGSSPQLSPAPSHSSGGSGGGGTGCSWATAPLPGHGFTFGSSASPVGPGQALKCMGVDATGACVGHPVQVAWSPFGAAGMLPQVQPQPGAYSMQMAGPPAMQMQMGTAWGHWPAPDQAVHYTARDAHAQHGGPAAAGSEGQEPQAAAAPVPCTSLDQAVAAPMAHAPQDDDPMDALGGDDAGGKCCWICLDAGGELIQPCK